MRHGETTGQRGNTPLTVVAAAVVEQGRLLVVSKKAAPDVFYLPGGKPEEGESPEVTLVRELDEELGVTPGGLALLGRFDEVAALEGVPMRLTVFRATLDREPRAAAELAALGWTDGADAYAPRYAPALRNHVVPLLRRLGALAGGPDGGSGA